jgi:hypothetical protein
MNRRLAMFASAFAALASASAVAVSANERRAEPADTLRHEPGSGRHPHQGAREKARRLRHLKRVSA